MSENHSRPLVLTAKRIIPILAALLLLFLFPSVQRAGAQDINVVLPILPGLAELDQNSTPKGLFINLFKAMDQVYANGRFNVSIVPFIRGMSYVGENADILFPSIPSDGSPYRFSTATVYNPKFFLYCRKDFPLTPEQARSGQFRIETDHAHRESFPFTNSTSISIESSLLKLFHGRIDGFLFAGASTDNALKELIRTGKMDEGALTQEFYEAFAAKFVIPWGPRGDALDALLSEILDELERSGKLREILAPLLEYYEKH